MKRIYSLCAVAQTVFLFAGCSVVSEDPAALDGYARNRAGRASAAEMCKSMRGFVSAPLDASGLRRARFLPFGSYDDGSFDFYAPMASNPSDDVSKAFYEHRVGQLTHYLRAPEFASALSGCLSERHGFTRLCRSQTENTFRASFRENRSGRSIEISAADDSTSVLIAEKGWSGDLEQALTFKTRDETPNKSIQPTCEDARG